MESVVRVVGAIARNRPLARVVLAYAVFAATQNAAWIGMLVYAFAQGGATTAGVVAVVQLGPAALVAPLAAGLADRRAPSRVLAGGYLVQVVGMLATALAIAADVASAAYAAAVVASVAVATTRPAQAVVVPALVSSAEELTAANAVTGWVESAGAVASSLVTGILLAVAGPGWVFAAAGLAGLASVGLAGTVRGVRQSDAISGSAIACNPVVTFRHDGVVDPLRADSRTASIGGERAARRQLATTADRLSAELQPGETATWVALSATLSPVLAVLTDRRLLAMPIIAGQPVQVATAPFTVRLGRKRIQGQTVEVVGAQGVTVSLVLASGDLDQVRLAADVPAAASVAPPHASVQEESSHPAAPPPPGSVGAWNWGRPVVT